MPLSSSRKITMSVVINPIYTATLATTPLSEASARWQQRSEQLSGGLKVSSVVDDAPGMARSMRRGAPPRSQEAISSHLGHAQSFRSSPDGARHGPGKLIQRIAELRLLCDEVPPPAPITPNNDAEFNALSAPLRAGTRKTLRAIRLGGPTETVSVGLTEGDATVRNSGAQDLASRPARVGAMIDRPVNSRGDAAGLGATISSASRRVATVPASGASKRSRRDFFPEFETFIMADHAAANRRSAPRECPSGTAALRALEANDVRGRCPACPGHPLFRSSSVAAEKRRPLLTPFTRRFRA